MLVQGYKISVRLEEYVQENMFMLYNMVTVINNNVLHFVLFCFLRVQLHDLSSLQPPPPGFK